MISTNLARMLITVATCVGAQPILSAPIHDAAGSGNLEGVKRFSLKRKDINSPNEHGATPLTLAAGNGHTEVVKYLISAGAQVDYKQDGKLTALTIAAIGGSVSTARVLLQSGADPNGLASPGDWTPLLVAAQKNHLELVAFLANNGANVNARSSRGWTPLMFVFADGTPSPVLTKEPRVEMITAVVALLKNGADPRAKNIDGKSVVMFASHYGYVTMVPYLADPSRFIEGYGGVKN